MNEIQARQHLANQGMEVLWRIAEIDRHIEMVDVTGQGSALALQPERKAAAALALDLMRRAGYEDAYVYVAALGRVLFVQDGQIVTRPTLSPSTVVARSLPPLPPLDELSPLDNFGRGPDPIRMAQASSFDAAVARATGELPDATS